MADKDRAALRRLSKKLSALRATLNKDERALLDRMILGKEVQAHRAVNKKSSAVGALQPEVIAHTAVRGSRSASTASTASTATRTANKSTSSARKTKASMAAEVQGHTALAPGTASTASTASTANRGVMGPASAAAGAALLEFDSTTGGYRPIGSAV